MIHNRKRRRAVLAEAQRLLDTCAVVPSAGLTILAIASGETVQDAVPALRVDPQGSRCCIQGLLFLAGIRTTTRKVKADASFGNVDTEAIRAFNQTVFGRDAALAECAFEGRDLFAPPDATVEELEDASRVCSNWMDARWRIRIVLRRLIDNDGTWSPQQE